MSNRKQDASLSRDLSILLLLLWTFAQAVLLALSAKENVTTYLVLFFCSDAAVLVSYLGRRNSGLALGGMITCVWVAWKLYAFYMKGATFYVMDYVLIPMPLVGVLAATLYEASVRMINQEIALLRRQVEEQVLIDDTTGLYNLRALYRDMQIMVHYCQRNNLPLTLFITQMRYEGELRRMLPAAKYSELRRRLADLVQNNVRAEDRVYCIDEHGTIAVLLTTTEEGSNVAKARIYGMLEKVDMSGVLERGTRLDMRSAAKQYDKDVYGTDMIRFKKAVEGELMYDV